MSDLLTTPLGVGPVTIANRFAVPAMVTRLSGDDGFVNDDDFVLFAGFYNELLDPRGDLTGDGLTDDADFVNFAGMYNELLCPS